MTTIFTKIIRKEISSYTIYEDDLVIAFLDISQSTRGHTLVVPKKEYSNIETIPHDVFVHLFSIVYKLSQILMKVFQAKGINLLNNNGIIAGQTIFHYHVHLIPRFNIQEIQIFLPNNMNKLTPKEYQRIQKKICNQLIS